MASFVYKFTQWYGGKKRGIYYPWWEEVKSALYTWALSIYLTKSLIQGYFNFPSHKNNPEERKSDILSCHEICRGITVDGIYNS